MRYRFSDLVLDTGRRQLSRDGKNIKLTKLSFDVLRVLVEAAPNLVSHDELVDRAWGERRVVTPENVAQRALMLRQALGDNASEPRYIENVRGQGLRLIPDVQALDATTENSGAKPSRPLWLALGGVALAVMAVFLADWQADEGPETAAESASQTALGRRVLGDGPTVGVLPFANLSPDHEKAFFAAGLHEEVLNQLSRLKGFGVISRTSMMRYADTKQSIPEIARELKVQHLIEGSVRYADDRIRVTIQLLDGASDTHLWSQTYDRELQDLFEIESDIARNVASVLRHRLTDEEATQIDRAPTGNLDAYAEYVLGNQALSERSAQGLQRALAHFERAAELDPEYLQAWLGQATAWNLMAEYAGADQQESLAHSKSALTKALAINPGSGEVWLLKAQISSRERDNDTADRQFQRALALNPGNARAWHAYAHFQLLHALRIEEGLEAMEVALALNPRAPELQAMYTAALYRVGEPEKGLQSMREAVARDPEFPIFYASMAWRLTADGQLAEALHWIRRGLQLPEPYPDLRGMECEALNQLDMTAEAEACIAELPGRDGGVQLSPDMDLHVIRNAASDHPEDWDRWVVGHTLAGRTELAMRMLQAVVPEYFSTGHVDVPPSLAPTAALTGMLLSAAGQAERGAYLMDQALATLQSMARNNQDGIELWEASIHVVRQQPERAIQALRDAIDRGWRRDWRVLRAPFFAPMLEIPEWAALVAWVEADIARQRELYEQHRHDAEWPKT